MAITTGLKVCYRFNAASRLKSKICAGHARPERTDFERAAPTRRRANGVARATFREEKRGPPTKECILRSMSPPTSPTIPNQLLKLPATEPTRPCPFLSIVVSLKNRIAARNFSLRRILAKPYGRTESLN